MRIEVHSSMDDRLETFRDVRDGVRRVERGQFLVEGRRNVEVLARQVRFASRAVLVTPAAFDAMGETWEKLSPSVPIFVGDKRLVNEVVGYDMHRGCLAVADRREDVGLAELLTLGPTLLVAEDLTDIDNVGSLFRNGLALGADGVLLSPRCSDPLYRKSVRVSMGAVLRLPYARADAWPGDLVGLRAAGYAIVALDPLEDAEDLDAFAARAPARVALVLGSEGGGLSDGVREIADARVGIRMSRGVDSLNVATAAAVALQRLGARL